MSAIRYSETNWASTAIVETSAWIIKSLICVVNDYLSLFASSWRITEAATKVPYYRTCHTTVPVILNYDKTKAWEAQLAEQQTAVGKGRWQITIGNHSGPLWGQSLKQAQYWALTIFRESFFDITTQLKTSISYSTIEYDIPRACKLQDFTKLRTIAICQQISC